jgi:hypothetical protein
MKRTLPSISAALFVLTGVANAQVVNSGGALALTGQVEGSVGFFFWQDPSGYQFAEGSSSTTIAIGDVSAYGTPNGLMPNKFTKAMDADGFHVTTPFQIQVTKANLSSPTFTLTANLGNNDDTVWEVDGVVLSTTLAQIAAAQPYTSKVQHTLYAKFPFTKTNTDLSDTITFTVTPN